MIRLCQSGVTDGFKLILVVSRNGDTIIFLISDIDRIHKRGVTAYESRLEEEPMSLF
jgi:hypothetical protein